MNIHLLSIALSPDQEHFLFGTRGGPKNPMTSMVRCSWPEASSFGWCIVGVLRRPTIEGRKILIDPRKTEKHFIA